MTEPSVDLGGLLEFSLTQPELSDDAIARAWETAKLSGVASIIVRPCDVDLVTRWMSGSGIRLGTVVDLPHGYSNTSSKLYAARDLLRRGAKEIDTVMNTGKLISRQFQYLEMELQQMAESCHESGAVLKVNIESEHLSEEMKIVACRVARRAKADYIGTNRAEDLPLLKEHSRERLKIKITAHGADLDTALAYREAGVDRVEVSDPASILASWKARQAALATASVES
jgi:deoxyribose-phosphate aldolase